MDWHNLPMNLRTIWDLPNPGNMHDPNQMVAVHWKCGHVTHIWMTKTEHAKQLYSGPALTDQKCAECELGRPA